MVRDHRSRYGGESTSARDSKRSESTAIFSCRTVHHTFYLFTQFVLQSFELEIYHNWRSSLNISGTVSLSLSSLTLALVSLYEASVIQNGVLEMTEVQTLELQQNDVTELQGLWDPIIHIESQLTQDDLIREIAKRLSEFLLSRGIFEQFCKILPSFGPPRHPKRSHRRDKSGRKSFATEVGSITSRPAAQMPILSLTSRPQEAGRKKSHSAEAHEERPSNSAGKITPNRRGSAQRLRSRKIARLPSRMFREDRTQMNTHETPQQRVLERLQRTSEQATEAAIESRYYKLTLYCQIKNIEEKLYDSGKSTSGVSFRTKALREWINETRCSELQEDDVKSWRDEGEKWKKLCDKFTPGILEVSHEALDASIEERGINHLIFLTEFSPSLRSKCLTLSGIAQTRMREYSLEEHLDESLLAKLLLPRNNPRFEKIRVLEAMVVNEQTKEKENDRAQRSDQEQNIDIEQEDMKLIAEAEQLFSRQVAIAEYDHKAVGYILPYRHTGVWHCMFRSSDLILVISVTASRKMKAVNKNLQTNVITVKRDDVQSLPIIIQREDFIPIIRCEDCKKYYGVIELLDPCWWTQYASCVLVSNRQDSPDSVDDDVRTKQESAKRKHPTNDALADLEYDLPRMKRSRLP
ncbi:hypothetical protein KCU95_g108, partial [Aureobasidium melanogenum]